jgi:hypothetical protein
VIYFPLYHLASVNIFFSCSKCIVFVALLREITIGLKALLILGILKLATLYSTMIPWNFVKINLDLEKVMKIKKSRNILDKCCLLLRGLVCLFKPVHDQKGRCTLILLSRILLPGWFKLKFRVWLLRPFLFALICNYLQRELSILAPCSNSTRAKYYPIITRKSQWYDPTWCSMICCTCATFTLWFAWVGAAVGQGHVVLHLVPLYRVEPGHGGLIVRQLLVLSCTYKN